MSNATEEERPLLGPKPDEYNHYQRRVIIITFVLFLLVDFADVFLDAPQTSILEGIICSRYYNFAEGEHDCTVGPVQAELATVSQLLNTFSRLPGLAMAIPFGIIADRYGRRLVLGLCISGTLLQDVIRKIVLWRPDVFAPRLIWSSSLATFIGGGDLVASAMIFLVLADVAPPAQRANLFFLMAAFGLIGEIVATPITALLMSRKGPWTPSFVYTALMSIAAIILLFALPETLRKPSPETETLPNATEANEELPVATDETPRHSTILSRFRPLLKHNVVAVLLAFFVSALGRQSTSFLLQYIRQRFNWSYEKASVLITIRAAVNLALLLVGLPVLNRVLIKRRMSALGKDLLITRLSVAFFAIGSLVICAAPVVPVVALGIVVFALGSGFSPAARSLVTTFCNQNEVGLLYSALAITQTIGSLVAGPLLALSFRWGLSLGHEWTGIPFAMVAGLFGFGFLAMSFVRQ